MPKYLDDDKGIMTYDETGHYTLRGIMSYGAKMMFIGANRGIGKTFGGKWFLINQFIECDSQCVLLFRNSSDVEMAVSTWLDDLCVKAPEGREPFAMERFEWEKGKSVMKLYFDGRLFAYFMAIVSVNHIKQMTFAGHENGGPGVDWVLFDEMIPMAYRKLPGIGENEGEAVMTIMRTIEHDVVNTREKRGVKPLRFIGFFNPLTLDNPLIRYFKLNVTGYGIHRIGPDIVCEMVEPEEKKRKSGKQTLMEFLGDEVDKTQGWLCENDFVGCKPKDSRPMWSVRVDNRYYVFYKHPSQPDWFVEVKDKHVDVRKIGSAEGKRKGEELLTKDMKGRLYHVAMTGGMTFENRNCKFGFIRDFMN